MDLKTSHSMKFAWDDSFEQGFFPLDILQCNIAAVPLPDYEALSNLAK